ncbi:hypothetical protein TTHERM_00812810 (macronuclear) [Tetrahymena thermophila SB210]|uniref:Uncharacterized protein n=1 Tax=Tetrahymena thermophila (strain SB210) TaxID=312017 RepID=Q22SV0_TETTS|nr:hypothetical protein TTHERM_00812810 [Tetrahymena thermophila SB210]EAR88364.2 hypothetical protein TTHERM_00812810 [Tetrahymena thermophila SB210]|eukprot:XP_001008609.2 hypothetical protein TTHERM_00812810 [Tetrahymena thermophila SB210]
MSIYSGFANRQLESNYNRLIEGTLRILQSRILKFYEEFPEDDKNFIKLLSKNVSYLAIMERNKYLPPKLSECLKDICSFLEIEIPSNEQQAINGNINNLQQEGLQRNNSFTRKSLNKSPTQQNNYQRTFSPIHNDYSTLKRSNSPGQLRAHSPKGGNSINYSNSKKSLSPIPQNNNQINQKRNQNGNYRTISPRGTNQNRTQTQNSQQKLNRDNSNGKMQPFPSVVQYSNQNSQQQYTKMNPNYLYNYNVKKQPLLVSKQQNNNRSQSPKGGYVQGYSNVNTQYKSQNNSRINSPRFSSSNIQSQNQQKNFYNPSQKNNTISEGNSQFYDYHINEKRNSSVQSRNFRMKTLNNSPSNKDYYQNDNQLTKRHNSSQIQKDLSNQFGLNKKSGINMQKRNSLTNKIVKNQERNGNEVIQNYNYNPNVQINNSNQSYLTKQKIRQSLEQNNNDYSLVDETISQMKQQINIYCKQNKQEQNPFEISPPQNSNTLQKGSYDPSSKILMQQLLQQSRQMNEKDNIVIETKSYTISKNQTQ